MLHSFPLISYKCCITTLEKTRLLYFSVGNGRKASFFGRWLEAGAWGGGNLTHNHLASAGEAARRAAGEAGREAGSHVPSVPELVLLC